MSSEIRGGEYVSYVRSPVRGGDRRGHHHRCHRTPLAKNLELDAAGRVTRYNTSGTVETWKVGLNYAPVRKFRVRVTRSRDIRAPNITELDSPLSETTAASPVIDPRNNQPVDVETFSSGNRDLVPEIAYTNTAGIVFEPTQARGLSASSTRSIVRNSQT